MPYLHGSSYMYGKLGSCTPHGFGCTLQEQRVGYLLHLHKSDAGVPPAVEEKRAGQVVELVVGGRSKIV